MECKKEENMEFCNCTYPCSKKGICCECIRYHLEMDELPACCFPDEIAATTERSFRKFVEIHKDLIGR